MASVTNMFRLVALSAALGQAAASFNLNTAGSSWAYTTDQLANTTSEACKDAYSATIDCEYALQEIVASMNPDFDPTASDLEAMCTTTCSDSLSTYVKNVKAACDQTGDLAGVASGNDVSYNAPVATVGEVFQYAYGEACAKNGTDYCYLTYSTSKDWGNGDFPCTDKCAVQFFQNAHDQPGSAYLFNYYALVTQSSWWEGVFGDGWKTVVKCGDVSPSTSTSSAKADVVDNPTRTISYDVAASTVQAGGTTTAVPVRSQVAEVTATSGASRHGAFRF